MEADTASNYEDQTVADEWTEFTYFDKCYYGSSDVSTTYEYGAYATKDLTGYSLVEDTTTPAQYYGIKIPVASIDVSDAAEEAAATIRDSSGVVSWTGMSDDSKTFGGQVFSVTLSKDDYAEVTDDTNA